MAWDQQGGCDVCEASRSRLGRAAEDMVERYLLQKGVEILERNYRDQYGHEELDIVARDGRSLIIVEVRSRRCSDPDDVLEGFSSSKAGHVKALAERYLCTRCDPRELEEVRFFLAGVLVSDDGNVEVVMFEDAF